MSDSPLRIVFVGVGLITGSLGLALRRRAPAHELIGLGRDAARLARAVERGAIDRYATDPAEALAGADVVILGVPLGATRAVFEWIAPALPANAIVTDVGSAKGCVVADAEQVLGAQITRFVPAHPIAGIEHSGIEAALAPLFDDHRVIVTPLAQTDPAATRTVTALWTQAGAKVIAMSVEHHDRMLAITSHLPHLLAFGLVDWLARAPDHEEILRYAAGGFRDFTRIASSDAVMWRDICLGNREAVLEALAGYRDDLAKLTTLIEAADGKGLTEVFERAKQTRDAHLHWFEGDG